MTPTTYLGHDAPAGDWLPNPKPNPSMIQISESDLLKACEDTGDRYYWIGKQRGIEIKQTAAFIQGIVVGLLLVLITQLIRSSLI